MCRETPDYTDLRNSIKQIQETVESVKNQLGKGTFSLYESICEIDLLTEKVEQVMYLIDQYENSHLRTVQITKFM